MKQVSGIIPDKPEKFTTNALSVPVHNYGNISAVIYFTTRALSVEWIRF